MSLSSSGRASPERDEYQGQATALALAAASPRRHDESAGHAGDRSVMDTFWTIMTFAFLGGVGACVGFVFFYWFVVIPTFISGKR
jgi:hypothetical protein